VTHSAPHRPHGSAIGKYFQRDRPLRDEDLTLKRPNFSKCGTCGRLMDLKSGPARGNFESRYLVCRACKKLHMIPPLGELSAYEHTCPLCNFQVLKIENQETGKSHTVCPKCFKDPPPPPLSVENIADTGGFRCFQCANSACGLAKRTVTFAPCPNRDCSGRLKLIKFEKTQKYAASCDAYPNCKFRYVSSRSLLFISYTKNSLTSNSFAYM